MSDLGNANWSETDASNSAATPNGWPEGQNPSTVNNCARAMMGATKRFWDRTNSVKTTAGSSTVYTLTYDVAAAALYDGEEFSFILDETCGAAPTLNINGLGAKNLRKLVGTTWTNLSAGDLVTGQPVRVRYNLADTKFDLLTQPRPWVPGETIAMAAAINEAKGADIASAATTDIGAATGNFVDVTGTTTITALGTVQAGTARTVRFMGSLTLTHNATSLILPDAADIKTVAGDVAAFRSLGSGNWVCVAYQCVARKITNSLGADVNLSNVATYFTGPTVAQGTVGTWFASGTVTMTDVSGSVANYFVKLWDGTTVIASTVVTSGANLWATATLSGYLTNPAGNIRISVKDTSQVNGLLLFNASGESKDSTLTALRVA